MLGEIITVTSTYFDFTFYYNGIRKWNFCHSPNTALLSCQIKKQWSPPPPTFSYKVVCVGIWMFADVTNEITLKIPALSRSESATCFQT